MGDGGASPESENEKRKRKAAPLLLNAGVVYVGGGGVGGGDGGGGGGGVALEAAAYCFGYLERYLAAGFGAHGSSGLCCSAGRLSLIAG